MFCLPNSSEGIPDWFEPQIIRGDTVSFWFRKKIPTITCIFSGIKLPSKFNLFVNSYKCFDSDYLFDNPERLENVILFDLDLDECIKKSFANKPELYEALKNNEWIHVELKWERYDLYLSQNFFGNPLHIYFVPNEIGIHVSWYGYDFWDIEDNFGDLEKSNEEGEVRFTDPYLNYSNNTSLSQFMPPLKKQRLVEVGVSGIDEEEGFSRKLDEDINALLSGMQNLVLTETK